VAPVPRIFLLSPATCSARRALMLRSPAARFELAARIQSPDGAPLGDVFAFLSGLYFRGKLTYAQVFARPPRRLSEGIRNQESGVRNQESGKRTRAARHLNPGSRILIPQVNGVFVITPSRGLQLPDYPVTAAVLEEFARVRIDAANDAYRRPLDASARLVAERAGPRAEVVLLGSIATGKYSDVLLDIFGDRLLFPVEFVGRGAMSRGGLMLRCARAGEELTCVPVRGTVLHGERAPRLEPIRRRRD